MTLRGRIRGEIPRTGAFSRIDLVALVFIVCLAAAVANPLLTSHSRARSDTLVCQANLAQIGRAHQLWGSDYEDRLPILVPTDQGGLRGHVLAPNAFIHFAWISNGLVTPKVLACPADPNTTRAKDFSANADGGLLYPAYRNSAISYFVGLHAQRYVPRSILSGDRNIEPRQLSGCSYVAFMAHELNPRISVWNQQIHWTKGNLLFDDGSVEETSTAQLRAAMPIADDAPFAGGVSHVLLPK